jgi:hypothetical protein
MTGTQSEVRPRGRAGWIVGAALVVAVAVTYGNALQNEFVFDDHLLIVDSRHVPKPVTDFASLRYRPLRTLSYRIDYAIGGMDPRIFHLSNLVYHAITVLLVCGILHVSGASLGASAAGALLFAVHPVQTDAVTYAAGRRDILCGLFFAAGFLAYLRFRRDGRVTALWMAAGAYALAILAKEMAVTLPLVCFAYDRWNRRREGTDHGVPEGAARAPADAPVRARSVASRYLWWAALLAGVGVLVFAPIYGRRLMRVLANTPWHGGSIDANFATVARIWVHYLWLVLWPATLSADYSSGAFPVSSSLLDPRALASLAVIAMVGVLALRSWRRGGYAGFGAVFAAITLLPVSHIVPYIELLADHYLYLPMIGVAFVVAGVVDAVAAYAPERRRVLAFAVLLVATAAASRTIVRNRDWHDKLSLWTATASAVPNCTRARFNLGQAYFERGRLDEAEREWLAAAEMRPNDPTIAMALASLYYRLGKFELAKARVDAALESKPGDLKARTLAGWIALDRGDPRTALAHFDAALARLPADKAEGARLGRERAELALNPPKHMVTRPGRRR